MNWMETLLIALGIDCIVLTFLALIMINKILNNMIKTRELLAKRRRRLWAKLKSTTYY